MNIRLLSLVIFCCYVIHGSNTESNQMNGQYFLTKLNTYFHTFKEAQDLFERQPTDTIFIPQASKTITTFMELLILIACHCKTKEEKLQLNATKRALSNIIDRQNNLIEQQIICYNRYSLALQRSHSAPPSLGAKALQRSHSAPPFLGVKNNELD